MEKPDVDIDQIKRLIELVEEYGLDELAVEEGDLSIAIKGRAAAAAADPKAASSAPSASEQPSARPAAAEEASASVRSAEPEGEIHDITAPLVGVFYRSPAPDAPPLVDVGDEIDIGSEVGLIEAMKVFSPIPSEVAGFVVDIPAQTGQLVRQGDVLVRVRLH